MRRLIFGLVFGAAPLIGGCGTTTSTAIALDHHHLPPHYGPVRIYATRDLPPGAKEIGLVEARAEGDDGDIDKLFPVLVQRAQDLGATALAVDWMDARFDMITTWELVSTSYGCGRSTCFHYDHVPRQQEIMSVVLRGRAFLVPTGIQQ